MLSESRLSRPMIRMLVVRPSQCEVTDDKPRCYSIHFRPRIAHDPPKPRNLFLDEGREILG
jgi:hypothetical protein